MSIKSLIFLAICMVLITSECNAIGLKFKLLKGKLFAIKAPHVAAKVAVGKEVKAKTAIAAAKAVGAFKAAKLAAFSVITAPIKIAKKSFAIKLGALKAAKAIKIAKLAGAISTLKKNPLLVPYTAPLGLAGAPLGLSAIGGVPYRIGASFGNAINAGGFNIANGFGNGLIATSSLSGTSGVEGNQYSSSGYDGSYKTEYSNSGGYFYSNPSNKYNTSYRPISKPYPAKDISEYSISYELPTETYSVPFSSHQQTMYDVPQETFVIPRTSYGVPHRSYGVPHKTYGVPDDL